MMAQYDDEEMGALDCEEIEGHITLQDEEVLKLAAAYEHDKTEGIRLGREIGKVVSFNYPCFIKCWILTTFWWIF